MYAHHQDKKLPFKRNTILLHVQSLQKGTTREQLLQGRRKSHTRESYSNGFNIHDLTARGNASHPQHFLTLLPSHRGCTLLCPTAP